MGTSRSGRFGGRRGAAVALVGLAIVVAVPVATTMMLRPPSQPGVPTFLTAPPLATNKPLALAE